MLELFRQRGNFVFHCITLYYIVTVISEFSKIQQKKDFKGLHNTYVFFFYRCWLSHNILLMAVVPVVGLVIVVSIADLCYYIMDS
jgi:hypothetical protein